MRRQQPPGHFGLPGMRERAAIVRGQLEVRSAIGFRNGDRAARSGRHRVWQVHAPVVVASVRADERSGVKMAALWCAGE